MNNRDIKLIDLVGVAVKRMWILILAAIIGAGVAFYYSKCIVVPVYRVSATFLVDMGSLTSDEKQIDQIEAQRQVVGSRYQVPSYVSILSTSDFSDAVAKRLKEKKDIYPLDYEYSAALLHLLVTFTFEDQLETYDMAVHAYTPDDALNIAKCIEDYSEEYVSTHKAMAKDTLRIIDHARKSTTPTNLSVPFNVAVGAILCVLVAFVICFIVEMTDVRIRSEVGVVEILGLPIIGNIPEYSTSIISGYRRYYRRRERKPYESYRYGYSSKKGKAE